MLLSALTDEELLRHGRGLQFTTPLEEELMARLERALDEIDALEESHGEDT